MKWEKNETLRDFPHKISKNSIHILQWISVFKKFEAKLKIIQKTICLDLDHQLSKFHSISKNIKQDLAL